MAVTRQRGKWVVDFRDKSGRRVQRRSPVQTKRGALQYEAQVKAELEEEEECPLRISAIVITSIAHRDHRDRSL